MENDKERAFRSECDAIILNYLKKCKTSGVTVVKERKEDAETKLFSIFDVLSLAEGKLAHRLTQSTLGKYNHFRTCVERIHIETLKECSDVPSEASLQEIERVFKTGVNVYVIEFFEGTYRTVLIRSTSLTKTEVNTVFLSGRFLFVNNVNQFLCTSTVNDARIDERPRLHWIKSHKHIRTFMRNSKGLSYLDDLGFFRCLAAHRNVKRFDEHALNYAEQFKLALPEGDKHKKVYVGDSFTLDPTKRQGGCFPNGLNIFSELPFLEKLFKVKINIYRLNVCKHVREDKDDECDDYENAKICPALVRCSANNQFADTLHLLAYEDRLFYITNINYFSQHITCHKCGKSIPSSEHFTHYRRCRGAKTNVCFNHKVFKVSRTLAQECKLHGVELPTELEYKPYFLCWDIETYTPEQEEEEKEDDEGEEEIAIVRQDIPSFTDDQLNLEALVSLADESDTSARVNETNTSKGESGGGKVDESNEVVGKSNTQFSTPHTLLSIGCASNVPGFTSAKVFITDGDSAKLVERFMEYVFEVQIAAAKEIAPLVKSTVQALLRSAKKKEATDLWDEIDNTLKERAQERYQNNERDNNNIDDPDDDPDDDDKPIDSDDDGSDEEPDLTSDPLIFDEVGLNAEADVKRERGPIPSKRCTRSTSALIGRLVSECRQLTLLSYNGGSFDQPIIAKYLLPYFNTSAEKCKKGKLSDDCLHAHFFPTKKRKNVSSHEQNAELQSEDAGDGDIGGWDDVHQKPSIIKKGSKYLLLSNSRLRLIDVINFTPAGTSYAQYLKGFKIDDSKLSFPYEFVTSLDMLDYPHLPSKDDFKNTLKRTELEDADYKICQELWRKENMKTFRDYLIAYNSADVVPFVKAVQKQKDHYQHDKQIHLFDYVSIPGVSTRLLHRDVPKGAWFSVLAKRDKDLYDSFNDALQGGPAIIFHRHAAVGEMIRPKEDDVPDRQTVQKILGLVSIFIFS